MHEALPEVANPMLTLRPHRAPTMPLHESDAHAKVVGLLADLVGTNRVGQDDHAIAPVDHEEPGPCMLGWRQPEITPPRIA